MSTARQKVLVVVMGPTAVGKTAVAIEVAKQYGSPKAGSFVNGLLDALVEDLKAEGRIQKLGRGLIGA